MRRVSQGVFQMIHPLSDQVWAEVVEQEDGSVIATYAPQCNGQIFKWKNIRFPSWDVAREQLTIGANRYLY